MVLRFSKKFSDQINVYKTQGYILSEAKANFIVYWNNNETNNEVSILLPELTFKSKAD